MASQNRSRSAPFAATRWSIVLAAGREGSAPRRSAMEELARLYWPPLYAYLRRDGYPPERAADFTQAFFARLIEKQDLRGVDPAKGKFRAFLLASLKHFVLNEHARERALKRGGGKVLSLDALEAESRFAAPASGQTPEQAFNRRWALTLLEMVLARLREEYAAKGQAELFEALKDSLAGGPEAGFAELGQRLGFPAGTLRVAAHRLRKRYRELLRSEVGQTVAGPEEVDAEIRALFDCL
jgi:RNA polymerase sigma-70 factor (ECF subfamily)